MLPALRLGFGTPGDAVSVCGVAGRHYDTLLGKRRKTMQQAMRDTLIRQNNAVESFLRFLVDEGFTTEEALKIKAVYQKERLIKFGANDGQWHIKHGAFLEPDVLRRAANL
jgi:hypothetical protein